jgi:hypothetical protein
MVWTIEVGFDVRLLGQCCKRVSIKSNPAMEFTTTSHKSRYSFLLSLLTVWFTVCFDGASGAYIEAEIDFKAGYEGRCQSTSLTSSTSCLCNFRCSIIDVACVNIPESSSYS